MRKRTVGWLSGRKRNRLGEFLVPATARCVPRRYTALDNGLVRAAGYTLTPTLLLGEPFVVRVASPLAA